LPFVASYLVAGFFAAIDFGNTTFDLSTATVEPVGVLDPDAAVPAPAAVLPPAVADAAPFGDAGLGGSGEIFFPLASKSGRFSFSLSAF
jgi:hypothetical protein